MRLAEEIIKVFEDFAVEKGIKIEIPEEIKSDENYYMCADIEDRIEKVLSGKRCWISTAMGGAVGEIEIGDVGAVIITSPQLDEYLENYSME